MAHPVLTMLARSRVRQGLIAKGTPFLKAVQLARTVDADDLDTAAGACGLALPSEDGLPPVLTGDLTGAAVGGPILDFFSQFLNSEMGKALIAFLVKLLLGGL